MSAKDKPDKRLSSYETQADYSPRPSLGEPFLVPTTTDEYRIRNRPYSEGDKRSSIARIQVPISAIGITCQKLYGLSCSRVSHKPGLDERSTSRWGFPEFDSSTACGRRRRDSEVSGAVLDG